MLRQSKCAGPHLLISVDATMDTRARQIPHIKCQLCKKFGIEFLTKAFGEHSPTIVSAMNARNVAGPSVLPSLLSSFFDSFI